MRLKALKKFELILLFYFKTLLEVTLTYCVTSFSSHVTVTGVTFQSHQKDISVFLCQFMTFLFQASLSLAEGETHLRSFNMIM